MAQSKAEALLDLEVVRAAIRLAAVPPLRRVGSGANMWAEEQIGKLMEELGLSSGDFLFHVSPVGICR